MVLLWFYPDQFHNHSHRIIVKPYKTSTSPSGVQSAGHRGHSWTGRDAQECREVLAGPIFSKGNPWKNQGKTIEKWELHRNIMGKR